MNQTLRTASFGKASDSSAFSISWVSLPELDYNVRYSPSLLDGSWITIGTVHSIGTQTTFIDTDTTRLSRSKAFYRIVLP